MNHATFSQAVEAFLEQADYLTDDDAPTVFGLRACAKELDASFSNAVYGQYLATYRRLTSRGKPGPAGPKPEPEQVDPLEEFFA